MRRRRSGDPVERAMFADEAHASATLLALLLLLWGTVSVFIVPALFRVVDVAHIVVGTLALAWFSATRRRPRLHVAYAFIAVVIVDALLVLPWITVTWCALGRPFEAVIVPRVAMLSMALIVPRSLRLALVIVALYLGEGLFVTVYADHLGLGARLPIGEPFGTIYFVLPAVCLLFLREHRRQMMRQHVRLRGETESLGRLGPLFARVRADLDGELKTLARELGREGGNAPTVARMERAAVQLEEVSARLDELTDHQGAPRSPPAAPIAALEREVLAHDAHYGAIVFTMLGAVLACLWGPIMATQVSRTAAAALAITAVTATVLFVDLVATRARPSERRALTAVLVLFGVALACVSYDQGALVATGRPFAPFVGHKVLMVMLGVAAARWSGLSLSLIVVTTAVALTLYFALGGNTLHDRISLVEPWVTLVFFVIGVAALVLRDQRRIASLALLRDETEAHALHRRARLLLGLRDRLNTPVQTLVIGSSRLELADPGHDRSRLDEAVARLVALSRELAQLDVPSVSQVDAVGDELHHAPPS